MILTTTARFTNMQAENMISEHLWHNTTCRHPPPRQSLHVVNSRHVNHYMSSSTAVHVITCRHMPPRQSLQVVTCHYPVTNTSITTRRHPPPRQSLHVVIRHCPVTTTSIITGRHLPLFSH